MADQTTGQRVLAISNLKKANGVWRGPSPLRPGSDSTGFALRLDDDGEHGAYTDHVTGEHGSLYELAEKLGIDTPKRAQAENTKRGYASLEEYALTHGAPVEAFQAAGWGEITVEGRPAAIWPTKTGNRIRFIDGAKGTTFKAEKTGYKACWYGLDRAMARAREIGAPLVICNGEPSVVVAQHYGIPATAQTGGEAHLVKMLPELTAVWDGPIVLALDCDETGRKAAHAAALAIGQRASIIDLGMTNKGDLADFCKLHTTTARETLYALKPVTVFAEAQDMPAPTVSHTNDLSKLISALNQAKAAFRESGQGVAPVLESIITEAERMLVEVAPVQEYGARELFDTFMDELYERRENPQKIRGLTTGLNVLDEAVGGFTPEVYLLYGATSMGKSTLAASIAAGFMRGVGDAPRPRGMYVTTETPTARWMYKVLAAMTGINTTRLESGEYDDADLRRMAEAVRYMRISDLAYEPSPNPTIRMIRERMARLADAGKPVDFVIVDSASKMSARGDGIYERTKQVSDGLQDLYREFNVPVIATSQVGRDVADRPRGQKMPRLDDGYGGGALEHNAGVVLGIYNHAYYVKRELEDEDEMTYPPGTVLLRILKARWGEPDVPNLRLGYTPGVGMYSVKSHTVNFREAI